MIQVIKTQKNFWLCVVLIGAILSSCQQKRQNESLPESTFKGEIKTDIRDSKPDWVPYTPVKAKEGAPNILFILYDDTGLAAWSPYGGGINMPTLDKIASKWIDIYKLAYNSTVLTNKVYTINRTKPSC